MECLIIMKKYNLFNINIQRPQKDIKKCSNLHKAILYLRRK